jgi:hypothetical protein
MSGKSQFHLSLSTEPTVYKFFEGVCLVLFFVAGRIIIFLATGSGPRAHWSETNANIASQSLTYI